MALYSLGVIAPNLGVGVFVTYTNQPLLEIKAGATDAPRLMEIEIQGEGSLSSSVMVMGRTTSMGTPKLFQNPIPLDPNSPPSPISIITDWVVPPGMPSQFLRRVSLSALASLFRGRVVFPSGLSLSPSSSIGLWVSGSASASAVMNVNVECDW